MKLVYADAVKAMIYEKVPLKLFMKRTIEGAHHSMGVLRSMIDEMPEADAVQVGRCKDCHYCKETPWNAPWYGSCQWFNTHSVDADGYCYKWRAKMDLEETDEVRTGF